MTAVPAKLGGGALALRALGAHDVERQSALLAERRVLRVIVAACIAPHRSSSASRAAGTERSFDHQGIGLTDHPAVRTCPWRAIRVPRTSTDDKAF